MTYNKFLALVLVIVGGIFFSVIQAVRYEAVDLSLEKETPNVPLSTTVMPEGNQCRIKTTLVGTPSLFVDTDQLRSATAQRKGDERWLTIRGRDQQGQMQTVGVSLNQLRACL
jgi:hypothetical protein